MLVKGKRPRELHWHHAGPMLFGDWGTSRLYVLGLCFFYTRHDSLWYMLAMSILLMWVGWAYQIICRLYPDGGGVYSSARHRSPVLGMIGGLLLCADYVVTAALSALDAFHYVALPHPHIWAAASIGVIGVVNFFGPRKSGAAAMVIAVLTVILTLVIALFAFPSLGNVHIERPAGSPLNWWTNLTFIILAISGVEAVANMTGIMVEPVARTARRSIFPVMAEIVVLNLLLTLAMLALPLDVLGNGDPAGAFSAHRDDMLRLLAAHYVGPAFAAVASLVFAFLLLSAVNTAITDLVSIQYMMSHDRELPDAFAGLNRFGMPAVPLVISTLVPFAVVIAVADVEKLAHLYAIGVVGAVAVNLGTCSTNFGLVIRRWERAGMMLLAVLMVAIWVTIAWEKPEGFFFAMGIMVAGMTGRWAAHNREKIRTWMLAPVPTMIPTPEQAPIPLLVSPRAEVQPAVPEAQPPTYTPVARVMVPTRGNPKLLEFALNEAKLRHAELLVLFVRHLAVVTMGSLNLPDTGADPEAQKMFDEIARAAAAEGVPARLLYAVSDDIAEAILDLAVTHGVDTLILGATQRGGLWRTMKGDVIQKVAAYLPERTSLLIHS